ncbi:hypothetical protein Rsub_10041 [Raphidocelis subcapitata]|uniref:Protein yippee-like n=1 Tax=Raphidocelis subcapitata TaxID=307507 RepID=A0A2V0PGY4_9CHLO|nr:hypothetical protein Rsub_10041 [Raphidocelis subcapitata]|eukprot:GBF97180.1 hypothetical protein Rsub_10041 [Raphidocelis subcapitata]
MGRLFIEYLEGRVYCCAGCHQHIAPHSKLISRQFHSKAGRAYLFGDVVNVALGPEEERLMTTGAHVVRDVTCSRCLKALGWRYERAHEPSQRYKEGKTILERVNVVVVHTAASDGARPPRSGYAIGGDDDSSDDECPV